METIRFETTEKLGTAKAVSKAALLEIIRAAVLEARGEDFVTQVGDSELSIAMGEYGEEELCINISLTAKEPTDRKTEKKEFTAYDRVAAGEAFKEKLEERERKKLEKAEKESAKTTED